MTARPTKATYSPSKAHRLEARISEQQKQLFQHAANLQGITLTDFVINHLQQAAIKTISQYEIIKLHANEKQSLIDALMDPPEPNDKLKGAFARYLEEVER